MQVIILKPAKSAIQSGLANTKYWIIKFLADNKMELKFPSQEEAIAYAKKNHLDYQVIESHEKKFTIRTYAENFN